MQGIATAKTHCILGASSSERWWNCPGSVHLIPQCPPVPPSGYALEGTQAHELAAHLLGRGSASLDADQIFNASDDMLDAVAVYVNYVREIIERHALPPEFIYIEKQVPLVGIDADGLPRFGTVDCGIVVPYTELHVIDYKHGAGKRVEVIGNKQALDYALGIFLILPPELAGEIPVIHITIIQPRCPGGGISTWTITREQLLDHYPAIQGAIFQTTDLAAPLVPGEHCDNTFCPARNYCPALQTHIHEVAGARFAIALAPQLPAPLELTPERIALIKTNAPLIRNWLDTIDDIALDRALKGEVFPGLKLVPKRSNRQWIDPADAESRLAATLPDGAAYIQKVVSPAQADKALKLYGITFDIDAMTHQPDNGSTLVPETDKRKAREPGDAFTSVIDV